MADCDRCGQEVLVAGKRVNIQGAALRCRDCTLRTLIAAEIEVHADDDSDVSDAYRHAAMIAKGTIT